MWLRQRAALLHQMEKKCSPCTGLALCDATTLELTQLLDQQDPKFVHRVLPRSMEQRLKLNYVVGGERFWYTGGSTVDNNYLRCLMDASRLAEEFGIVRFSFRAFPRRQCRVNMPESQILCMTGPVALKCCASKHHC